MRATHVAWLDREGTADRNLAALAAEQNCVVVTNDRRDFLRLYAELEVHNGLIIIVPKVPRAEQIRLFGIAPDVADRREGFVNLLIEVRVDGRTEVRNWSKGNAEGAG